jgi:hypothetical protein
VDVKIDEWKKTPMVEEHRNWIWGIKKSSFTKEKMTIRKYRGDL